MTKKTVIFDHPLISHKIALLRDVNTDTKLFRALVEEISMLMAYEALKDIPTDVKEVTTPLESVNHVVVKENSVAIVPVLRAGLGMVNGVLALLPTANVGHIGLYRDKQTGDVNKYYCKLPENIQDKVVILLEPMLASGKSLCQAIDILKQQGCKAIKVMSIISAPEGIAKVEKEHPDVQLYIAYNDRCLDDNGYILPGLGDAGNRLFGTK
ncbi:MAG: uracil phosphoribosyltransferase [Clostridia bacterium]|nr:uracil phosphoribosyltransferase [Clostridia bacterium]